MGRKAAATDWRLKEQDETMRGRLNLAATIAQSFSAGCFIGMLVTERNGWIIGLTFLMIAVDLGLYLAFPAYFTLMDGKAFRKYGYRAQVRDMGSPLVACVLALGMTGMRSYTLFFARAEIGMVAAVCAALGLVLWKFSRECRAHIEYLVGTLFLVALFGGPCLAHVNYLTDFDIPAAQYCEVVDTTRTSGSRGRKRYDCTVDLGNGETIEVAISYRVYEELESGDRVPIVISKGGLGLEYAYFDRDTYFYG